MRSPPRLEPHEWANLNRSFPAGTSEAGPYRFERTPYIVSPGVACVRPEFTHVCMVGPSQYGKTQLAFNVAGHRLDERPVPILYIGPTRSIVTTTIAPKIDALLRGCESLWSKTTHGKKYTTLKKIVSGVGFRLAWAGSPTELASDSAGFVIVDELDRMESSIGNEGSVIELADARHTTYQDGKTLVTSSPTEANIEPYVDERTGMEHWRVASADDVRSPVWQLWQQGSRHEWAVPCPECREYFAPRFKLLWWPEKSSPKQALRDARLTCPSCGTQITSGRRHWMNSRGVYVAPGQKPRRLAKNERGVILEDHTGGSLVVHRIGFYEFVMPEDATSRVASFWMSGLMAQTGKNTFGTIAEAWLNATGTGDDEPVKGVLNTRLGECWHFGGDAPLFSEVAAHRSSYSKGDLPDGVRLITAGVDVQANRLEYVVRGWGAQWESWLIDEDELWGNTDEDEVWRDLENLLSQTWGGMSIAMMGVDSGYRTETVYRFAYDHPRNVKATKGHDILSSGKAWYASKVQVTERGRPLKGRSVELHHMNLDFFKTWVHGRIRRAPDLPGAWHLPGDVTDDYCKQIVAEQRVPKPSGKVKWVQTSRHNHKLDCEVICRMLAERLKRHIARRVRAAAAKRTEAKTPASDYDTQQVKPEDRTKPQQAPRQPPRQRRRRSGFVSGFGG